MSENKDKPDLKIVCINEARKAQEVEIEEVDEWTSEMVRAYTEARELFLEIEDPELYFEAVKNLRAAFLLALNPLQSVDDNFIIYVEEDKEDE